MEYPSWLKALAIDSLQKRRVFADLIFTYKVWTQFGLNDMNSPEFFTLNSNYRETRKLKPYKLHSLFHIVELILENIFSRNELRQCGTV